MKPVAWESALERIQQDVKRVESRLHEVVTSPIALVSQVNHHTLDAGGKRLRPAFVLLSAQAANPGVDLARPIELGACMEMIHMATLIHDDVIDHAGSRRGRPTASAIFGNTAAILSGDVLLAKAMHILATDGEIELIRVVSRMVVEMVEGEAREVELRGEFDISLEEHLRVLHLKTASFVDCCCRIGGMCSGHPEHAEALGAYGANLGLAFQIVDDLLDYRGDPQATGKPVATDFREGCATLPLIDLRDHLTEEELEFTGNRFGHEATDDEIAMISGWMEARGSYQRAAERAHYHCEKALDHLETLPKSEVRDLLAAVIEFVQTRKH